MFIKRNYAIMRTEHVHHPEYVYVCSNFKMQHPYTCMNVFFGITFVLIQIMGELLRLMWYLGSIESLCHLLLPYYIAIFFTVGWQLAPSC